MSLDHPGFADPVLDSQACFRAVLDAMSRPGTVHVAAAPAQPPAPLDRATAAVLLTLVDAETSLFMDPAAEAAAEWIAFHCGAPRAPAETATFALLMGGAIQPTHFAAGSDEAPETGATLIVQVAAIGSGQRYVLEGPGLDGASAVQIEGLDPGFCAAWAANRALFPRGVDLVLCAGDRLAAFPRTLSVREA